MSLSITKEITWLQKEKYNGKETPEFKADVLRLEKGEPLAYVIGWSDFLGCRIDLSYHPLIPRPETEYLTEQAITVLKEYNRPLRILDIFAGSGCIGVALLKHLPQATVDFGEADPRLEKQIRENIAQNDIALDRGRIIIGNVFEKISDRYDVIFANPPYIDPAKKPTLNKSVIDYEPHIALFAGDHGLEHIKTLVNEGGKYLKKDGMMYIEYDTPEQERIAMLLENTPWEYQFFSDQYAQTRFLRLEPLKTHPRSHR